MTKVMYSDGHIYGKIKLYLSAHNHQV